MVVIQNGAAAPGVFENLLCLELQFIQIKELLLVAAPGVLTS